MAVHNGFPFVTEAVDSILAQTFEQFELLILDDGSVDGTSKYLRALEDPRVRVINLDHVGLTRALNRGLEEAQGELIARQDLWPFCMGI